MKIRKLDPLTINRIAAGEIIHRPASAIKELVENSIDAKSSQISITCKMGGLKQFTIQDNGTGIEKDDLNIVCERFTTSKLVKFQDLEEIQTFGFRGEALASISHVGHVIITTRTADSQCAFKCQYENGALVQQKPCAGNQGTTIAVEDLFFNLPTRLRALKPTEEYNRTLSIIQKYAIHYPHVTFTCKNMASVKNDLHTAKTNSSLEVISLIYGPDLAKNLIDFEINNHEFEYKAKGILQNPNSSYKKKELILFINHRLVEFPQFKKQLDLLYQNYLPKGAGYFTYFEIEIDPRRIDVNIHPTKSQVQMLNQDQIIEDICKSIDAKLTITETSRVFYVQTKLINEISTPSKPLNKRKDSELVRVDAKERKITDFLEFTSQTKEPSPQQREIVTKNDSTQVIPNEHTQVNEQMSPLMGLQNNSDLEELEEIPASPLRQIEHGVFTNVIVPPSSPVGISTFQNADINLSGIPCSPLQSFDYSDEIDTKGNIDSLPIINDSKENKAPIEKPTILNEKENLLGIEGAIGSSFRNLKQNDDDQVTKPKINDEKDSENSVRPWLDVKLISIQELRAHIQEYENAALSRVFQNFVLVGVHSPKVVLIQNETRLLLVDFEAVTFEMCWQLVIFGFANFGLTFLEPSVDLNRLDGGKFVFENRQMLHEYFGLVVDEDNHLVGLPALIPDYYPDQTKIASFIEMLEKVNWRVEKECFVGVAKAIAWLYSLKDVDSNLNIEGMVKALSVGLGYMRAPNQWIANSTVRQLAELSDLYKIFERC